jgi:hypothetical protein
MRHRPLLFLFILRFVCLTRTATAADLRASEAKNRIVECYLWGTAADTHRAAKSRGNPTSLPRLNPFSLSFWV